VGVSPFHQYVNSAVTHFNFIADGRNRDGNASGKVQRRLQVFAVFVNYFESHYVSVALEYATDDPA
jgi:hypothetical protein